MKRNHSSIVEQFIEKYKEKAIVFKSAKELEQKYELTVFKVIRKNITLTPEELRLFNKYKKDERATDIRLKITKRVVIAEDTDIESGVVATNKLFENQEDYVERFFHTTMSDLLALQTELEKHFKGPDLNIREQEFSVLLDNVLLYFKKPSKQKDLTFAANMLALYKQTIQEIIHLNHLEEKLQFSNYQNSFIEARQMKRKIKVFIGPTNSGKTYAAFEELKKASSGAYLAPLRLLAHEGGDKLFERSVLASVVTGEERKILPGATHVCSTIEMTQLNKEFDCVVIDEIQMLADPQRGWAWTQALVGVRAKEIILVGSPEIMPVLQPLLEELKDPYEIVTFERKNKLKIGPSLDSNINNLKDGDCLIVFNRKDALAYKKSLSQVGKPCSVIYGNLSPELRVAEARKFNAGNTKILIATDAIGMGLNLPIKRVFFSKTRKFNGIENKLIEPSLIKQIAGRAGRYGMTEEAGLVSTLEPGDLPYIKKCINEPYPDYLTDTRCFIQPNTIHIEEICNSLNTKSISPALIFFREKMVNNSKFFKPSHLEDMIYLSKHIDKYKFDIKSAYLYCTAPVDIKNEEIFGIFKTWLEAARSGNSVKAPKLPQGVVSGVVNDYNLFQAENYIKIINIYKWLSNHWPKVYYDIEQVEKNSCLACNYIESILSTKIQKLSNNMQRRRR